MKPSTQLAKKISAYSLFAGAFLATEKSDAQIIYTDVIPDDTLHLNINNFALMDFDNDGHADMMISGYSFDSVKYWTIGFAGAYGSVGIIQDGNDGNVAALSAGYSICQSNSHLIFLGLGWGTVLSQEGSLLYGDLQPGDHDKFIGVAPIIPDDGNRNYGWIRVDVAADTSYIIVKDYAVNLAPDSCIAAGEGIPLMSCTDEFEPNNSSPQASLIPLNKKVHGLIDVPGDKDWFQFTPNASKNNVRILLKSLPKNYNLRLLDQNLQRLAKSVNPGRMYDTIEYNNLDPLQHYYVVVRGQNTDAFDGDDCYTLKIETSSTPYKLVEQDTTSNDLTDLRIFPNPASSVLFFSGLQDNYNMADMTVYDLSGRKMAEVKMSEDGNAIDVSSLSDGMYLLQMKSEHTILVRKFEIKR